MPTQRPFRFGVSSHGMASRDELYSQARKAEHLGYATFLVNDHLASTFAPVPAIIAAAEATTTLRVALYLHNSLGEAPAKIYSIARAL
jgi:alkanesulfonate monooxygenase SsuD/methylene tetrahydromethanopterin reductase-like flavin-dependent oxidoreductase (luciferase family)